MRYHLSEVIFMKKEKTANGAVLITGAAGGMGNAAAKLLAGEGHPVYGVDLREPEDLSGMTFFRFEALLRRQIRIQEFSQNLYS